jgi:TM2 domain-containing membrane protein YozV
MKKEYEENLYGYIKKFVAPNHALLLKKEFETINDAGYARFLKLPLKNPIFTLILSIFFGTMGIDRFYLGDVVYGVIKLVVYLISWFVSILILADGGGYEIGFVFLPSTIMYYLDIFFCFSTTKYRNFKTLTSILPKDSDLKN